jgi:hypothetical protein
LIPEYLRPTTCDLASAVATGLARSGTFRSVAARVGELNGVVYIQPGVIVQTAAERELHGALLHNAARIGGRRALFVVLRPGLGNLTVATLAHELQHAVEVLESDATTESQIDALFVHIGTEVGAGTVETLRANLVQQTVARELARRR